MKSCGNNTTHKAGALGSGAHAKPGSRLRPALEAKARKRVFCASGALGGQQMGGICSNSGSLTLGENRGERQMSQRYIHTTGQRDATGPIRLVWMAGQQSHGPGTQCSLSIKGQQIFEGLFFLLLTLISSGMANRGRGKISHGCRKFKLFIVRKKGDCFAARVTI